MQVLFARLAFTEERERCRRLVRRRIRRVLRGKATRSAAAVQSVAARRRRRGSDARVGGIVSRQWFAPIPAEKIPSSPCAAPLPSVTATMSQRQRSGP